MSTRSLHWSTLLITCVDILLCAYANSLHPHWLNVALAGFCASCGVTAIKYLWRTRKAGVRA